MPNNFHINLAKYFSKKPLYFDETTEKKPNTRKLVEQPWQQTKGEMWEEVTNTLCNLDFIQAKAAAMMSFELVKDFNEVLMGIPDNAETIRDEKKSQARIEKYIKDLIDFAKGGIVELDIPESLTPWTEEQVTMEIDRMKTNPTLTDKLKDFLAFLGNEADNLQKYACLFPCFATQQAWNYAVDGPVGKAAENASPKTYEFLFLRYTYHRPHWNPIPQVIKTMKVHTGFVISVSITPDGKRAISGSTDKTCILWDLTTGKAIQILRGHRGDVLSVSITPDAKRAISGSLDDTCIVWDLMTGEVLQILKGHTSCVEAVSITPDGAMGISGSWDKTCILWNLTTGKAIQILRGHSGKVNSASITPDAQRAISGSSDTTCIFWDLTTGKAIQILRDHSDNVCSVSITPDAKRAISGSSDTTCIFWDLTTGKAIQVLRGHSDMVCSVSITPDAKKAISGSINKTFYFWDLTKGDVIQTLKGHGCTIRLMDPCNDIYEGHVAISITADGSKAISGSDDKICILWNLTFGLATQTINGNDGIIRTVCITPDGKTAITNSKKYACWDIKTGEPSGILGSFLENITITPDGKKVIMGDQYHCFVLDLDTRLNFFDLNPKLLKGMRGLICITPDGKNAISFSSPNKFLWNLTTGKSLVNHNKSRIAQISAICITPDGKRAISSCWDNTCILWNLPKGKAIQTLQGHSGPVLTVAITPDGTRAVSGSFDHTCILWDMRTQKAIKTLIGHSGMVLGVSISPDGKRVVSCSLDRTCILWDLESGKYLARLVTKTGLLVAAVFSTGVVLGTDTDGVTILKINKKMLSPGLTITSIRQIWDFELQQYQEFSADCLWCGHRFEPATSILEVIEKITKEVALRPEQSPCLELPDEAWEEPGLLGNCPKCGEKLKFNPFIAGEYKPKPIWKFWKR